MADRKIICKIITGSRLYGTNRPDSDEDYTGVFLPSTKDLLGLQNCPTEWTENVKNSTGDRNEQGDVDCKYFSLQRFISLAASGQPGQLELLFAPESATLISTPEWKAILASRDLFLSRNGIAPFVGFALAQAHKATIKGDNLKAIRALIEWGDKLTPHEGNQPLGSYLYARCTPKEVCFIGPSIGDCHLPLFDMTFDMLENDHGYTTFRVAGRQFDPGTKAKTFINALKELEGKYGTRSEAALEKGFDYKSLMHAYRLLSQAREFLADGNITLPRPDAEFLKTIRAEAYKADYFAEITAKIDEIRQTVEPASKLAKAPNRGKLEELCQKILYRHLFG